MSNPSYQNDKKEWSMSFTAILHKFPPYCMQYQGQNNNHHSKKKKTKKTWWYSCRLSCSSAEVNIYFCLNTIVSSGYFWLPKISNIKVLHKIGKNSHFLELSKNRIHRSIVPLKELQSMLVKALVLYWFCLCCLLKLKCYLQKYTN